MHKTELSISFATGADYDNAIVTNARNSIEQPTLCHFFLHLTGALATCIDIHYD